MKTQFAIAAALAMVANLAMVTPQIVLAQDEVSLTPTKDTSLYEDTAGVIANGSGHFLFAGRTGAGLIRRALLAFDVADAVPAGATITEAELTLNLSRSPGGTFRVAVHALTADWGEGSSAAGGQEGRGTAAVEGDATWLHTSFDTEMWKTAGGDFDSTESAGTDVAGTLGSYSWSGEGLITDAQRWLDTPESNFGWILIGDETTRTNARRFDSRENLSEDTRPKLRIAYSVTTSTSDDEIPNTVVLLSNYPNPFSGVTTIKYVLSTPQTVALDIHDLQGRIVATLVNGRQSAGSHDIIFDTGDLAPGPYLYRLSGQTFTSSSTLLVLP